MAKKKRRRMRTASASTRNPSGQKVKITVAGQTYKGALAGLKSFIKRHLKNVDVKKRR
jgi:hypothetical protein